MYEGSAYTPPSGTTFRFVVVSDPWGDYLVDKTSGFTAVADTNLRFDIAALDIASLNPQFPHYYELLATEPAASAKVVQSGTLRITPAEDTTPVPTNPYASPSPFSPAVFEAKWGDTTTIELSLRSRGLPVDVTGGKLYFTLKANKSDLDGAALLAKESPAGITVVNAASGDVEITLTAAETGALAKDTPLYWDVQYRTPDLEIFTVREGIIVFTQDVTQRTA